MTDRTVRVVLQAVVDGYRKSMQTAAKDTEALGAKAKKSTADTHKALGDLGRGSMVAGGALLAGFGVAVTAAAGFEKQMSGVKAVSNATAGEMKRLSDAALKAGADTVFSASDAAKAEGELAKAGVSVSDILGGALRGSLSLAAAGQLDLADAATVSAQAMNVFKLGGKDVGHIADVLAAAANKSAADVKDLGDGLRQSGLVAAQTGLSLEDTAGVLAAFADNALVGSDAGTSLKTMLQRLTPQSAEAADLMKKLGISAYDSSGNFVGLANFAQNLQDSLKGLTAEQRNSALATIFGSDAVRAAAILYDQGASGINDYVSAVNDQGAAARMASTQMDNLAGDVEALKGSLETALIKGGSGANGMLRALTQSATEAVNAFSGLPTSVQQGVIGLAGVAGAAGLAGGAVMIGVGQLAKFKTSLLEVGISAERTGKLVKGAGLAMKGLGAVGAATALLGVLEQINTAGAKQSNLPRITEGLVDVAQHSQLTGEALRTFGTDFEKLGKKIDVAGRGYWTSFTTGQKSIKNARQDLDDLDKALAGLLEQGHGDEAAAIFEQIEYAARKQGVSVNDLNKTFNDYRDAQAQARTETKLATGATNSAAASADEYAKKLDQQKQASKEAADAIRAESDALKAQFDPIFAVQDALAQKAQAEKEAADAARKHGRSSQEYADAANAALRATVGVDTAVESLRAGLNDGSVSLSVVNARLDAYVRAGLLSADAARRYKDQLAGVVTQAQHTANTLDNLNGKRPKPKVDTRSIDSAQAKADRLGRKLETLDRQRAVPHVDIVIRGILQGGGLAGVMRDSDFKPQRASGGAVQAGQTYQVNELGQEFFTPWTSGRMLSAADSRAMAGQLTSGRATYEITNYYPEPEPVSEALPRVMSQITYLYGNG